MISHPIQAQHITDSLVATIGYYMQTIHPNLLSFFLVEYQFPKSVVVKKFNKLGWIVCI